MKRRTFVTGSLLAAAAATWPGWLRRAFADASLGAGGELGVARRRGAGKPVLAIPIPDDDGEKWKRGRAIGGWINNGDDGDLWPLALVEVACVRRAELPSLDAATWLALVDERGARPVAVPALPEPDWGRDLEAVDHVTKQLVDNRRKLAAAARRAIAPDEAAVAALAARATQALGRDAEAVAARAIAADSPSLEAVDRMASLVALRALRAEVRERARLQTLLAQAARARLRTHEIPGSKWARQTSCGEEIENVPPEQQTMVDCGMGAVSPEGARFLYLFTLPRR